MASDPITVCYLATLVFLCAVLAAIVFGGREAVITLFMKNTLRTYIVIVVLSVGAGAVALLLWAHLGGMRP